MPEPTPALVRAVGEAIEDACLTHLGRDVGTIHRDDIARAAIAAMPPAEHCIHSADMHQRYHQPANPIPGCPWCSGQAGTDDVPTPEGTL